MGMTRMPWAAEGKAGQAYIEVNCDVNVDNVSLRQSPGVWNAVAHALVDGCAHALGKLPCTGRNCLENLCVYQAFSDVQQLAVISDSSTAYTERSS